MAKTGERYGAARPSLIDRAAAPAPSSWAAEPELNDEAVESGTGRRWDEWRSLIDAWPGHGQGHSAIVAFLQKEHGVDGWWAQTVTIGYERITGRRLPYQQPNGTFTAGKSRTVVVDASALRSMLLDDADRAALFPGLETELRSRPTSKVVRIAIGPGTAQIGLDLRAGGRVSISIAHKGLPAFDDVDRWKAFWGEWLAAIEEQ